MSSRALRRLQQEAAVIKVSGDVEESSSGDEEKPGFSASRSNKSSVSNPFAAVSVLLKRSVLKAREMV